MQRLIKTICCENGELYSTSNARRVLLARCGVRLEIMEDSQDIPMLGGYKVKRRHVMIVLCSDMEFTRKADVDFLKTVTAYDLSVDIQRQDGVYEPIPITNIRPEEIDLDGEWKFEVEGRPDLFRKLLSL